MARFKSERRRASIARFKNEEDGSLIAFSLFIFVAMLMFGGIAVDLMIYENKRTHIQNSTDRAVLAAANLNQTVDPQNCGSGLPSPRLGFLSIETMYKLSRPVLHLSSPVVRCQFRSMPKPKPC